MQKIHSYHRLHKCLYAQVFLKEAGDNTLILFAKLLVRDFGKDSLEPGL